MFLPSQRTITLAGASRRCLSLRRLTTTAVAALFLPLATAAVPAAQFFDDWSPAVSVDPLRLSGINTPFNDGCPIEAPDEHMLFFASNRHPADPLATKDLDIWVGYRDADGTWGDAAPLDSPVNTGAQEFCPTPLPGNQLLFVSTRSHACGGGPDIFYTRLQLHRGAPAWLEPVPFPCETATLLPSVNSPCEEFSPSLVEAEGRMILFFSSNRDTGCAANGAHKIYASERQPDGTWGPAEAMEELSAGGSAARPNVRKDGLEIVFDSNRSGSFDIYTARRESVAEPWRDIQPLGPNVNDPVHHETRASLSRDGTRLYFGSTRANAVLGGAMSDIYVSTRLGPGNASR